MNDETTRLLNETTGNTQPTAAAPVQNPKAAPAKGKKAHGKTVDAAMYAAGGAVVGAAVGAVVSASATRSDELNPELVNPEEDATTTVTADVADAQAETPDENQVILANDEGVRYAHVEADNFNDAFAQARAQVGAGGVFEYNGRLYGTYTADEWGNMSAEERADYQSRVNEVAPAHHSAPAHHAAAPHYASATVDTGAHQPQPETVAHNAEMISPEPVEGNIRVLGVEAVQTPDGQMLNVAVLENNGDQAMLVDVDFNGSMDYLLHDDNGDGMLQESEVHDISGAEIHVDDLLAAQAAQQQDDYFLAANDDMPDYINDADSLMSV